MDIEITARKRYEAFEHVAEILGVDSPPPSTKADPIVREAHMAELLLALAERVAALEETLAAAPEDDTADLTGDLADE